MWYKNLKTSSYEESNEEWLERHKIIREGDYYVFFHGSRAIFDELNANSLLEDSPERARDFGDTNYLADKRLKLHVYKVLVKPEDIITGFWAKTNKKLSVVALSKKEQDYYNRIKKEGA
jgi:hypothetical protein